MDVAVAFTLSASTACTISSPRTPSACSDRRIERIASEQTGITADTALRLAKAFGTTPDLWMNLQKEFDIRTAQRQIGSALEQIEPLATRAA